MSQQFHTVFAEAIEARGVSLSWLQGRLEDRGVRVGLSTLSSWRAGHRHPERVNSMAALAQLEDLLGLDPGSLSASLGPSRRLGPPPPTVPTAELAELPASAQEVLRDLGFDAFSDRCREISIHVAVDVDEHGNDTHVETRLVLRSLVDGLLDYPVGIFGLAPAETAALESVVGASIDQERVIEEVGLQVWSLRLDTPTDTGDTFALEHTIRLPPTPHRHCEYYVERRVREFVMWVRFHPDRLPSRVELIDSTAEPSRSAIYPAPGSQVAVIRHGYGPGTLRVQWDW